MNMDLCWLLIFFAGWFRAYDKEREANTGRPWAEKKGRLKCAFDSMVWFIELGRYLADISYKP